MTNNTVAVDNMRRAWLDNELPSFTMVGGYPLFYLTDDDCVICPNCVNDDGSDRTIVNTGINWESEMYCDECSGPVESAYDTVE